MNHVDLTEQIHAHGGFVEGDDGGVLLASLPEAKLFLRAEGDAIAWAYEETFDRWANSRDAITAMPRDAAQFALMVDYLTADRWKRNEALVSYREAKQWSKKQRVKP